MGFRRAKKEDIKKIMSIIKKAQAYLKAEGVNQWQNNYPNEETIEKDIDDGNFYVLVEDNKILGITALIFGEDITYKKIYEGKWLTEGKYAVIHRMAVDLEEKRKGLASKILKEAEKTTMDNNIYSIRVDTHRDNKAMQGLLEKNGFKYCGIIYLKDGNERLAFEKILNK